MAPARASTTTQVQVVSSSSILFIFPEHEAVGRVGVEGTDDLAQYFFIYL